MFYYISGKLAALERELERGFAVIDAGGVGYKLTVSGTTYDRMPPHLSVSQPPEVKLYTYMSVREDDVELFGFATLEELSAFKMLISVSGVGPKVANCIALFAMGKFDSFPIDVWVKKVMNQMYGFDENNLKGMAEFAAEKFGEYGGIAQQYLFYYITHENARNA